MKNTPLLLLLSAATVFAEPSRIGLLPEEKKTTVTVDPNERSPFGSRRVAAEEVKISGDEALIREIIVRLPLSGMTRGYGVIKVLLGPYLIEEGKMMPPVIPNQVEKVKVLSISPKMVELGFVDKDGSTETRKLSLPIALTPVVRFKMGTNPPAVSTTGALNGVIKNEGGTSQ